MTVLRIVLLVAACLSAMAGPCAAAGEKTINKADLRGAGATFPAPLYRRWIEEYQKANPGLTISYDAVGSGDGIKLFLADKVDFGASDAAMTDIQMKEAPHGAQLIPATAGIIVLAYNLPGVQGRLKLSRRACAGIFMGEIGKWNDPAIAKDNPELNLPDTDIVIVARSDGSGTTFAMTNHLNRLTPAWSGSGPGVGKKIQWPGKTMLARGNQGVARKIQFSRGSIGYVEYGFAKRAELAMAALENKAGAFVAPGVESGSVTLRNMSRALPENLRLFMPDPAGKTSYPIITYSWLLLKKTYGDAAVRDKLKAFVAWGLKQGQRRAEEYGYTPLPPEVAAKGLAALENVH